jgi:hypothetical protein
MNAVDTLLGGLVGKATAAAGDAAAVQAAAVYEQYKPLIWLAAVMAVTVYLFYFVPRFTWPWRSSPS